MNPDDPLGNRLTAEARANRPAFNAQLHARVMNALPAEQLPDRTGFTSDHWWFRAAALVAVIASVGAVSVSIWMSPPPTVVDNGASAVPVPIAYSDPEKQDVAHADPEVAESSRQILSLARVRPVKMLGQLLSASTEPAAPEAEEEPDHQPQSASVADLISIRVLSRAPFLDMQFKPQGQAHDSAPRN